MRNRRGRCFVATAGLFTFWATPGLPQTTANYADISASLGYSSNPFLRVGESQGSAVARLSVRGVHGWTGLHSSTRVSGFVEGSSYFNHYGVKSIFALSASHSRQLSERVHVFGSASVSGDIAGQLANRFIYAEPAPPDVPVPPPVIVGVPEQYDYSGRHYDIFGQIGATVQTSEHASLGLSGGVRRSLFTRAGLSDFTTSFARVSYDRAISPRTTVGADLVVDRTDYDSSARSSTSVSPALTARTQLSEHWQASGSVGFSLTSFNRAGDHRNSTNLAFSASLCHSGMEDQFCGRVARFTQASALATPVTSSSAGVDWTRRLDERQSVQISASFVHYSDRNEPADARFASDHFQAAATYSRRINERFSGGVEASMRTLR